MPVPTLLRAAITTTPAPSLTTSPRSLKAPTTCSRFCRRCSDDTVRGVAPETAAARLPGCLASGARVRASPGGRPAASRRRVSALDHRRVTTRGHRRTAVLTGGPEVLDEGDALADKAIRQEQDGQKLLRQLKNSRPRRVAISSNRWPTAGDRYASEFSCSTAGILVAVVDHLRDALIGRAAKNPPDPQIH
jgi:hypothetical protein